MDSFFAIESWDNKLYLQVSASDIQAVFNHLEGELSCHSFKVYEIGATDKTVLDGQIPNNASSIKERLTRHVKVTNIGRD